MFDLERFIDLCRAALAEDETHKAVREVVARAVTDPGNVMEGLGKPTLGGINRLYQAPDLTILNVVWAPRMTIMPHNHNMWAVVGVYSGREDNIFWRRLSDDPEGRIEAAGAKSLGIAETAPLGGNIIHSVTNPTSKFTGALHVYGGDFYEMERSEWEPETLVESPYSVEHSLSVFAEANARV